MSLSVQDVVLYGHNVYGLTDVKLTKMVEHMRLREDMQYAEDREKWAEFCQCVP
jgi:hypothetical protein